MIPLPERVRFSGSDLRYCRAAEKRMLHDGRPFEICDAQLDHGAELDAAFVIRWLDSSERMLWTRHPSPSRIRLAHIVLEAVENGETIGPVCCELLPATTPGNSAFPAVVNHRPPKADALAPTQEQLDELEREDFGGNVTYPAAVGQ